MFIKKLNGDQGRGPRLLSATWIKAVGKARNILGKLHTNKKVFNGGELKGNRDHLLETIDINLLKKNKNNPKKVWRSVNLETLTSLKIGGIEWM